MSTDERPLSDEEFLWIDSNQRELTELIDCRDLLQVIFYTFNCISKQHFDKMQSLGSPTELKQTLIEIMKRRSKKNCDSFCKALEMTGQKLIASALQKGFGGLILINIIGMC